MPVQLKQDKSSNAAVPGGESDVECAGGGKTGEAELALARFSSPAA